MSLEEIDEIRGNRTSDQMGGHSTNDSLPVPLKKGVFVISLDFELAWGTRGRKWANVVASDLDGTRRAIDHLLELLHKHELSATWVLVGAMLMGGIPRHRWLLDPQYDDVPFGDYKSHPHWYADDILERLRSTRPAQDIGCHTLTHMFVQDTAACRAQFDLELKRSVELFGELGLPAPKSFIYPKHYMAHFDLLPKHGIRCYRGPEAGWFENLPTKLLKAGGRFLSSRLHQSPSVGVPYLSPHGLWVIPSSQFYPSFRSVGKHLSVADRVSRAIKGLNLAARKRAVYHLWTHPFNLGVRTDELLGGLDQIFAHAGVLRDQGTLETHSMAALASKLQNTHGS